MCHMQKKRRIYLDHAAATPLDRGVLAAMEHYFTEEFGNPSALYREAVSAKKALLDARRTIAEILFAHADEIVFTGGGTEANNLAIRGVLNAARKNNFPANKKPHIITSVIEHPSVLAVCRALEQEGVDVSYIGVDRNGILDLDAFKKALRPETVLVSLMYANNEIGTIEPIREAGKIVRSWRKQHTASFPYIHTDACQAANYLSLHVERLGIDLMTLNGGKIYGPKGAGAFYVRRGVPIAPMIWGGGQERGIRSGTENVAGAVGLARALAVAEKMKEKESKRLSLLRDRLIASLLKNIPDAILNGDAKERLPNNVNISIPGIESEQLIIELDAKGVAASAKSACKSLDEEPSYVIMALGRDTQGTESGVRLTLGRNTTKNDINAVSKMLPELVKKIRNTPRL